MHAKNNSFERIVLGTVALGMPYGIGNKEMPEACEVAQLFQLAKNVGICQLDTAPSYGQAEELVGVYAVPLGFQVWTKLSNIQLDDFALDNAITSIEKSIATLRKDKIACLQWHNWTSDLQSNSYFLKIWKHAKENPQVSKLGASTYGVENAMAAVKSQLFDLVQIEWNLLNQSVLDAVGEEAKRRKVKIALRSVFLQGVLTDKGEDLTGQLSGFRKKAKNLASEIGLTINALALRCALDHPMCPNVLVGPNRASQLQQICFDAQLPPVPSEVWNRIGELTVSDASLVDPRFWKK